MILVDTSIWIDHLRDGDLTLEGLLEKGAILGHPWVQGELALGNLTNREETLGLLSRLPKATVATPAEILTLVERQQLHGVGIGYVDAQLLTSTKLTRDARLWSKDRRLATAAARMGVAFDKHNP